MNFLENITFHRTRTKSDSTLNDSEVAAMQTLNETTTSIPEMSDGDDGELKKIARPNC